MPGRVNHATRGVGLTAFLTLVLLASVFAAGGSRSNAAPPDTPNVIVVMADDMRFDDLKFMPNVRQKIAGQGVTFDRSYVPYSLCCPSRATYLTGQYSHNNHVKANGNLADGTPGGYYALDGTRTLPVWMQNAGYTTAHIGKYLNRYGSQDPTEVPQGWNEWDSSPQSDIYKMYGYTMNQNGVLRTYGTDPDDYRTSVETGLARQFIRTERVKPGPFFLSMAPLPPHDDVEAHQETTHGTTPAPGDDHAFDDLPLPKPPSFNEKDVSDKPARVRGIRRYSRSTTRKVTRAYRRRLESLLSVDRMVGSIISELSRPGGELDDTYIIFTSDNGWMLGEHRIAFAKVVPYEESIKVPLLIRGPDLPEGAHRDQLAANIDLAPTITDIGNATTTRAMDGISLLPIADHNKYSNRAIELETFYPIGHHLRGLRVGRWVYIKNQRDKTELYDLKRDPYELRNRAGSHLPSYRRHVRRLDRLLDKLKTCKGAACAIKPPKI